MIPWLCCNSKPPAALQPLDDSAALELAVMLDRI
jgi:hypothetical protein